MNILVVDDEEPFRRLLNNELTRKGYAVEVAPTAAKPCAFCATRAFDVDPPRCRHARHGRPVAHEEAEGGSGGTGDHRPHRQGDGRDRGGGHEERGLRLSHQALQARRARDRHRPGLRVQPASASRASSWSRSWSGRNPPSSSSGKSRQLQDILALIQKVAPTDSPVFIQGESGTGKELVANTVWHYSTRKDAPFIALNCAALSENLLETELFGHEKGAFTGADQRSTASSRWRTRERSSWTRSARCPSGSRPSSCASSTASSGGWAGARPRAWTCGIIAATNKDLAGHDQAGTFREDLYYRLNVITVAIPPLRERKEDIAELSRHFLTIYAKKLSKIHHGLHRRGAGRSWDTTGRATCGSWRT